MWHMILRLKMVVKAYCKLQQKIEEGIPQMKLIGCGQK